MSSSVDSVSSNKNPDIVNLANMNARLFILNSSYGKYLAEDLTCTTDPRRALSDEKVIEVTHDFLQKALYSQDVSGLKKICQNLKENIDKFIGKSGRDKELEACPIIKVVTRILKIIAEEPLIDKALVKIFSQTISIKNNSIDLDKVLSKNPKELAPNEIQYLKYYASIAVFEMRFFDDILVQATSWGQLVDRKADLESHGVSFIPNGPLAYSTKFPENFSSFEMEEEDYALALQAAKVLKSLQNKRITIDSYSAQSCISEVFERLSKEANKNQVFRTYALGFCYFDLETFYLKQACSDTLSKLACMIPRFVDKKTAPETEAFFKHFPLLEKACALYQAYAKDLLCYTAGIQFCESENKKTCELNKNARNPKDFITNISLHSVPKTWKMRSNFYDNFLILLESYEKKHFEMSCRYKSVYSHLKALSASSSLTVNGEFSLSEKDTLPTSDEFNHAWDKNLNKIQLSLSTLTLAEKNGLDLFSKHSFEDLIFEAQLETGFTGFTIGNTSITARPYKPRTKFQERTNFKAELEEQSAFCFEAPSFLESTTSKITSSDELKKSDFEKALNIAYLKVFPEAEGNKENIVIKSDQIVTTCQDSIPNQVVLQEELSKDEKKKTLHIETKQAQNVSVQPTALACVSKIRKITYARHVWRWNNLTSNPFSDPDYINQKLTPTAKETIRFRHAVGGKDLDALVAMRGPDSVFIDPQTKRRYNSITFGAKIIYPDSRISYGKFSYGFAENSNVLCHRFFTFCTQAELHDEYNSLGEVEYTSDASLTKEQEEEAQSLSLPEPTKGVSSQTALALKRVEKVHDSVYNIDVHAFFV